MPTIVLYGILDVLAFNISGALYPAVPMSWLRPVAVAKDDIP